MFLDILYVTRHVASKMQAEGEGGVEGFMLLAVITPHGPFQHAFWLATPLDPLPGCVCVCSFV